MDWFESIAMHGVLGAFAAAVMLAAAGAFIAGAMIAILWATHKDEK